MWCTTSRDFWQEMNFYFLRWKSLSTPESCSRLLKSQLLWFASNYIGPAKAIPFYLLKHQWTKWWLYALIVTMIEDVIAIILCEYLSAMPRAEEEISFLACYNGRRKPFGHWVTISISKNSRQSATSANKKFVGVIFVPTCTYEHIPISIVAV